MDANRVKQILSSSADIEVKYHGTSVWIEGLNEEENIATVQLRGPSEEKTQVSIEELSEDK